MERRILTPLELKLSKKPRQARRWKLHSVDPEIAMALYRRNFTLKEIARHLTVSYVTLRNAIKNYPDYSDIAAANRAHNRSNTGGHHPKKVDDKQVWRFYLENRTVSEIASYFQVKPATIYGYLRRHREYKALSKARRKERPYGRRFSRDRAFRLRQSGASFAEIASRMGVQPNTFYYALKDMSGYKELVNRQTFPREEAWELFKKGYSLIKLARKYKVSAPAIRAALEKMPDYEMFARQHEQSIHKRVVTPDGIFETATLAARHYNVSIPTVNYRCTRGKRHGWRYA